jgi:divalent metal cation (Fe/Co/Zn/Cd) transporter
VGVGHLVAGTALVAMGAFLVWDSGSGLLAGEHPPVGTADLAGHTMWGGWLMIAALAYTAVPPVLLGRAKMPLAAALHDRVLHADADMNKADWMTAVGGIVGIAGIGVGLWWADAVAALFISGSILRDGVRNVRTAVTALMDAEAQTVDGTSPHPLLGRIDETLRDEPWVETARSRVRDQGHVFHVESFVVPHAGRLPTFEELEHARVAVADLDWKVQDLVLVVVPELPEAMLPGLGERPPADDARDPARPPTSPSTPGGPRDAAPRREHDGHPKEAP